MVLQSGIKVKLKVVELVLGQVVDSVKFFVFFEDVKNSVMKIFVGWKNFKEGQNVIFCRFFVIDNLNLVDQCYFLFELEEIN